MNIKRETVNKLHVLTEATVKAEAHASELLRIAQDRYNHVEHKVERDGKEVTITRKVLWDEVFYLGAGSDSAKILKEHHPEVFDAYKVQEDAAKALQDFVSTEMEMDFKKMRISDYVKLTEAMIDLKLSENDKND